MSIHPQILENIERHNKVAKKYKQIHTEIYNEVEQKRLAQEIAKIAERLDTKNKKVVALDFGCGDGNLTNYLLQNGFQTIAADVSTGFLDLIKSKFPQVETKVLNGVDLSNFEDSSVDFICTYSVLHHIPDYLKAVEEFCRVIKPGGIIMLDHEVCEDYWDKQPELQNFFKSAMPIFNRLQKFLKPQNYINKLKTIKDPKYAAEGDIHVFADDRIEWPMIIDIFNKNNFSDIHMHKYLLFRGGYRAEVYNEYKDTLFDTSMLVAQK
jgi:ubiquinone/menaquinone biosynthesis C-methylase UbiE